MGNYFSSTASKDDAQQRDESDPVRTPPVAPSPLPLRPAETPDAAGAVAPTGLKPAPTGLKPAPTGASPAEPSYTREYKDGVTEESLRYSHDVAVRELTSLYEFHALVHRDGEQDDGEIEWVLAHPPPTTGWPGNWDERVSSGEFTQAAVDLIRRLPRIVYPGDGEPTETLYIMEDTVFLSQFGGHSDRFDPPDDPERGWYRPPGTCNLPPHMIRFTRCGNRYGYDVVLDTSNGCVLWQKFFTNCCLPNYIEMRANVLYKVDKGDDEPESSLGSYHAYDLEVFVATVKECFVNMWWMPNLENEGWEVAECHSATSFNEYDQRRRQIMKDAGWPDPSWDKAKAVQEMRKAYEERQIQ
jgi:hypothetical protein